MLLNGWVSSSSISTSKFRAADWNRPGKRNPSRTSRTPTGAACSGSWMRFSPAPDAPCAAATPATNLFPSVGSPKVEGRSESAVLPVFLTGLASFGCTSVAGAAARVFTNCSEQFAGGARPSRNGPAASGGPPHSSRPGPTRGFRPPKPPAGVRRCPGRHSRPRAACCPRFPSRPT
jgi:hypothetical protein